MDNQGRTAPTGVVVADTPAQVAVATAVPTKKPAAFRNMAQAEAAYDAGRISEDRYDQLIDQLEAEMDTQTRRPKLDYENGRI